MINEQPWTDILSFHSNCLSISASSSPSPLDTLTSVITTMMTTKRFYVRFSFVLVGDESVSIICSICFLFDSERMRFEKRRKELSTILERDNDDEDDEDGDTALIELFVEDRRNIRFCSGFLTFSCLNSKVWLLHRILFFSRYLVNIYWSLLLLLLLHFFLLLLLRILIHVNSLSWRFPRVYLAQHQITHKVRARGIFAYTSRLKPILLSLPLFS